MKFAQWGLSRYHLSNIVIPREQQTGQDIKDFTPSGFNMKHLLKMFWKPPRSYRATMVYLCSKVPPKSTMNTLQSYCVLSSSEISSDNESALAGSKVEPLWPLQIIIMCKTQLILWILMLGINKFKVSQKSTFCHDYNNHSVWKIQI